MNANAVVANKTAATNANKDIAVVENGGPAISFAIAANIIYKCCGFSVLPPPAELVHAPYITIFFGINGVDVDAVPKL